MIHSTNEPRTTATAGETPKIRAYLEAHPGWADEPFTWLFRAGFSLEEFAYFADMAMVQRHGVQVSL